MKYFPIDTLWTTHLISFPTSWKQTMTSTWMCASCTEQSQPMGFLINLFMAEWYTLGKHFGKDSFFHLFLCKLAYSISNCSLSHHLAARFFLEHLLFFYYPIVAMLVTIFGPNGWCPSTSILITDILITQTAQPIACQDKLPNVY